MVADTGFEVRHALDPEHVEHLLALYRESWWAAERRRPKIERMLAATDVLVAVVQVRTGRLVAFARALTDDVYFAMVLDVIVAGAFQKRGLGRVLLDAMVTHPRLATVRSLELVCQPDLVPLYRRWGFDERVGSSTLMRRARRD